MIVSDTVSYVQVYFIHGELTKEMKRRHGPQGVKDGPSGWSNAFVIAEGDHRRILIPYTCEGWEVPADCYELEATREIRNTYDPVALQDMIVRAGRSGLRHKITLDHVGIECVLKAMGFEMPEDLKAEKPAELEDAPRKAREASPVKKAREGLHSIKDLSETLKLTPRIIRGYLRKAKVEKPEHGWAGDKKWLDRVTKVVKAEIAKEKGAA